MTVENSESTSSEHKIRRSGPQGRVSVDITSSTFSVYTM